MKNEIEKIYRFIYRPLKNIETLEEIPSKVLGQMIIKKKGSWGFEDSLQEGDKSFLLDVKETVEAMSKAGFSISAKSLLPFIMEKYSILVRSASLLDIVEIQGCQYSVQKALDSKTVWSPFVSEKGLNADFKVKSFIYAGVNSEGVPEYLTLETDAEVKAYLESGFRAAQLAGQKAKHLLTNPGLKLLLEEQGAQTFLKKENVLYCITKKSGFFAKDSLFEREIGIKLEREDEIELQNIFLT